MLATKIAGLPLETCIYNASGPRTGSTQALENIGASRSGAILAKSATLVKQDGNALPRYVKEINLGDSYCEGSLNSEGLPNLGIDYYIGNDHVAKMNAFGKPYIVSLSGLSLADNLEMLKKVMAVEKGIAAIELNLACPNIPGKPTVAYDFKQMEEVVESVCKFIRENNNPKNNHVPPLGVKLAPYLDPLHVDEATKIIVKYPEIKFVVAINTMGNALIVDADEECAKIAAKSGFGGLGGGFVKQSALANVRMLTTQLEQKGRSDIDVIGVGGIATGKDAFEMILCGAKAVQIATRHGIEGASCFDRVAKELEEIMKKKGYTTIDQFRGKLKPFRKKSASSNTNTNENQENDNPQKKSKQATTTATSMASSKQVNLFYHNATIIALLGVTAYLMYSKYFLT